MLWLSSLIRELLPPLAYNILSGRTCYDHVINLVIVYAAIDSNRFVKQVQLGKTEEKKKIEIEQGTFQKWVFTNCSDTCHPLVLFPLGCERWWLSNNRLESSLNKHYLIDKGINQYTYTCDIWDDEHFITCTSLCMHNKTLAWIAFFCLFCFVCLVFTFHFLWSPKWAYHNAAAYAGYGSSWGFPIPGRRMYAKGGWSPAEGQVVQLQGIM